MPALELRPATPEDREAVLAFCQHTWKWGDYIEYVWDEWLHDKQGVLLVATFDHQPVGIAHLQMLTATEAWLEGLRVDPAHRHHGIATALQQTMLAEAMRRGATVARLMTESTNTASLSMLERSPFRRVAAFAPFKALPQTILPKRRYGLETPQLATLADIDDIIDYLNVSNTFPAIGGLYYYAFRAYSISDTLLAAKIAAQQVYILRRWERLDGLAIAEVRDGRQGLQLSLGYIDGTTESISLIAYALRRKAAEMELDSIYAYVPDLIMIRDAFTGAEYEWDDMVFYTYERGLT
jgi:GNAT superfamily N-acetyltransferase